MQVVAISLCSWGSCTVVIPRSGKAPDYSRTAVRGFLERAKHCGSKDR